MGRSLSLRSAWQPGLAGGCPKHDTYGLNPQFVLTPSLPASFTIELTQTPGGDLLPIGIVVLTNKPGTPFKTPLAKKKLIAKTSYKAVSTATVSLTIERPPPGTDYVILPSTFEPEQYASFKLTVSSDDDGAFTLAPRDERAITSVAQGGGATAVASSGAAARKLRCTHEGWGAGGATFSLYHITRKDFSAPIQTVSASE